MKSRYYPELNVWVTEKPSQALIRWVPPGGRVVSLWFTREKAPQDFLERDEERIKRIWKVALYVGPKKDAGRWKRSRSGETRITGDGTIDALMWALEFILLWRDNMRWNEELQIGGADARRERAYRRLLRHGFEETYTDEGAVIYWTRNPNNWIPIPAEDTP